MTPSTCNTAARKQTSIYKHVCAEHLLAEQMSGLAEELACRTATIATQL